jgi:hypothetical protein
MARTAAIDRFWSKVEKDSETGCWLWTAATTDGYGQLWVDGRMVYAHRYSYEYHVGPIPTDKQLDHTCRVRRCVNPRHLEPVTCRENVL